MTHSKHDREKLLKQLGLVPIVGIACNRAGVPRSTYYRWRAEDPIFAASADESLGEGVAVINDAAESNVIKGIKDGSTNLTRYWLEHHHPTYGGLKFDHSSQHNSEEEKYRLLNEEFEEKLRAFLDDRHNDLVDNQVS